MEEKNTTNEKLSYEELERVASDLSVKVSKYEAYVKQLQEALMEANYTNMFRRLDYLFKVLEYNALFDNDFVDNSIKEITTLMTPPTEEETKE